MAAGEYVFWVNETDDFVTDEFDNLIWVDYIRAKRRRSIYSEYGIFVSQKAADEFPQSGDFLGQLTRVQTLNDNIERNQADTNQFGQLAALDKRDIQKPNIDFDVSWHCVDFSNENKLGLVVDSNVSVVDGLLKHTTDNKNVYYVIAEEGVDLNNVPSELYKSGELYTTRGYGNCYIQSYTFEASVGGFPNGSASFVANNVTQIFDAKGSVPSVDPDTGIGGTGTFYIGTPTSGYVGQETVLQQGQVTLDLTANSMLFQKIENACVQSATLSLDFNRDRQECLGKAYPSHPIRPPIDVTLNIDILTRDFTEGNLADFICSGIGHDLAINLYDKNCSTGNDERLMYFQVKNARLQSQSSTQSIGPDSTMTMTWIASVGGSGDTTNGLFLSGVTGYMTGVPIFSN